MIMGDGLLSLSWNNHSSTFCHMLSTIRGMEKYSDVTLACDGRFYPAHKLVLSTCSDYFHNMFEKTPCKHPIIVIKDVAFKNIEALLSYMYAGIVNVSQSDLAQLIKAAELLEIKGLAVPDEPPSTSKRSSHAQGSSSSPKRSSHMRASSTSPQRKRHRRDTSPLTHDSTAVSSPGSPDSSPHRRDTKQTREPTARHTDRGETRQDQSKDSKGERKSSREIDREAHQIQNHSAEQADEHLSSVESSDNLPEALNESLIKEEKVEVECDGDGGYDYGALLGGLPGEGDDSTHTMQHFPHHTFDNNPGPSGLQGWSGVSDGGDGGGTGYGSETSSDLQLITQQGQQHHLQHPNALLEDAYGLKMVGKDQVKSHHCSLCSYSACYKYLLLRHMRTHTGEKPHCCPHCSYRAARKDCLKQHIATHNLTLKSIESGENFMSDTHTQSDDKFLPPS